MNPHPCAVFSDVHTPEDLTIFWETHTQLVQDRLDQVRQSPSDPHVCFSLIDEALAHADYLREVIAIYLRLSHDEAFHMAANRLAPLMSLLKFTIYQDRTLFAQVQSYPNHLLDEAMLVWRKNYLTQALHYGAHLSEVEQHRIRENLTRIDYLASEIEMETRTAETTLDLTKKEATALGLKQRSYHMTVPSDYLYQSEKTLPPLRRLLWESYFHLGWKQNRVPLKEILRLRHETAVMLGYPTWADYQLCLHDAQTPDQVFTFLDTIGSEIKDILDPLLARWSKKYHHGDPIYPWDLQKMLSAFKKDLGIDESVMSMHTSSHYVMATAFRIASDVFGLVFEPMETMPPLWTDHIRGYNVFEKTTGRFLATFFFDNTYVDGKNKACFHSSLRLEGHDATCEIISCPSPWFSARSIGNFFHEFGHALQWLLMKTTYQQEKDLPTDMIEFHSSLLEILSLRNDIVREYAIGDPLDSPQKAMPKKTRHNILLLEKVTKLFHFQQQIAIYAYSVYVHMLPLSFEALGTLAGSFMQRYSSFTLPDTFPPMIGLQYHIAKDLYAAGFYTYLYNLVRAHDVLDAYEQEGDSTRLVQEIYEPGLTRPFEASLHQFLRRSWNHDAFLRYYRDVAY